MNRLCSTAFQNSTLPDFMRTSHVSHFIRHAARALVLFGLIPVAASAQLAGGSISGTITDPTNAVIPDASVTVRNRDTGVAVVTRTNNEGFYSAPDRTPGNYEIIVQTANFAPETLKGIVLNVGGQLVINVALHLSTTSETVDITEQLPDVDIASYTVASTVTGQTVRDLPLNGRDWAQLATLEPGVKIISTQTASQVNLGYGTQMTVSGNRPQNNNYRLDGISINDYSGGGPGNVIGGNSGVDAIQEFSVVTSLATADYARTAGGVLNAVTRAGTNQFHGSAYEFARNSVFDAPNYFDYGLAPPFSRNQFGGSLGGPIRRDHAFFFVNYEGLRQSLTTTTPVTVLSPNARNGQLTSGSVAVAASVKPYLTLIPRADSSILGDTGISHQVGTTNTSSNFFDTRLDAQISTRDSLYGTFLSENSSADFPDAYNFVNGEVLSNRKLLTLQEAHTFRSSLVNVFRAGYSRAVALSNTALSALNPLASDPSLGFIPGRPIGTFTVPALTSFTGGVGAQASYAYHYNSYQVYDDVLITSGTHSIKTGFAFERIEANQLGSGSAPNGGFKFGSIKSFLTATPTSFSSRLPGPTLPIDMRQSILGIYAQDAWRANPRVAVDYGVRYEFASVPTETAGRLATLTSLTDTAPKIGSPYFNNPNYLNFSPRIGLAIDPLGDGKTAIHAGFGLYDTLPLTYQFDLVTLNTAPYSLQGQSTKLTTGSFPTAAYGSLTPASLRVSYVDQNPKRSYVEQWGLNVQHAFGTHYSLLLGYTGSHGVHQPFRTQDNDLVLPSVTAQGALLWPKNGTRLNTNFGQIQALTWRATTSYHALETRATAHFGKSLRMEASYTYAKSLDLGSASVSGAQFDNSLTGLFFQSMRYWYGPADFDVRHNFILNTDWRTPELRNRGAALNTVARGWQLNGIFEAASGQPFTVLISGDPLGMGSTQPFDFPNRIRTGACANPTLHSTVTYINAACFTVPSPGTQLGSSGRNSVYGPGLTTLDASLFRIFHLPVSERSQLELRAEVFNALNHPNFNPPSTAAAAVFDQSLSPIIGAGALSRTSTTSRQMQFAAKLSF